MFQHSALPTNPVDIPQSLPRIGILQGLAQVDRIVPLPRTLGSYLLWTLGMLALVGLALLQVWTTMRISETRLELQALALEHTLIEQRNAELLWQISQYTTLAHVEERAAALGYRPALQRQYLQPTVAQQAESAPPTPIPPAAAGPADSVPGISPRAGFGFASLAQGQDGLSLLRSWWQPHGGALGGWLQEWRARIAAAAAEIDFPPIEPGSGIRGMGAP